MKKITLGFIFTAIAGLSVSAQITLHQSDLPVANYAYYQGNDTIPTVTQGAAGANQTWNLAAIKDNTTDSLICLNPAETPYASDFPGTNLALTQNGNGGEVFIYANSTASSLTVPGEVYAVSGLTETVKINPVETVIELPATYLSHWKSTYRQVAKYPYSTTGIDSIEEISKTTLDDSIDSWGNVTTPTGTYGSLRVNEISTTLYDSEYYHSTASKTWVFASASGASTPTQSFVWWANGKGINVAEVDLGSVGGTVTGASYLKKSQVAGIDEITDNGKVKVFPNPANTVLNIQTAGYNAGNVKIYDLAGKEMGSTNFGNGRVTINTSDYSDGMYLYIVTDMQGNVLARDKFTVAR
ncbi:MAG: T9SS type A sorting domain-containing protein [Bacteroidia bacterium]